MTKRSDKNLAAPSPALRWTRKDLLGLRELSAEEITFVLNTADAFKQVGTREIKKVPALRGKTLINFFVEPSTRTRISFELAASRLSADVINISASTSSLAKGETLKDTAKVLEANHADIIVLRHSSAGAPQFLAQRLRSSVVNAGDGAHEHPTQALLDLYTIREKRGRIDNLHVVIVGDILFSRVARSNIFGLLKLGAKVTLVGPSTLVPREFEKLGVSVSHKIDNVLPDADVVSLAQQGREAKLADLPWREPVGLDTLRLYAALYPQAPDVELDAVAADLDVDVRGRHTALGDALVTAEVYRRLLPLLGAAGVRTLGEALAFAERPPMIRRLQRALGW